MRIYDERTCRALRAQCLDEHVVPLVEKTFRTYDALQSAALLVAQYWNDEAHDAVHGYLVYSSAPRPDLAAWVARCDAFHAGNAPTAGFDAWREAYSRPLRTHHGFTQYALRRPVWSEAQELAGSWDSVHPPRGVDPGWLPDALPEGTCLEVMYGTHALGTGRAVELAMDGGVRLAVDVSHVHIQLCQGAMEPSTWARLREYAHVEEIHVSATTGAATATHRSRRAPSAWRGCGSVRVTEFRWCWRATGTG